MKHLVVLLTAALILSPVGLVIAGAGDTAPADEEAAAEQKTVESQRLILFYYFHGTRRCKTCRLIETTAHDIVSALFTEELKGGEIAWKAVNYDEPENDHFIKDFGLVSSSLVIVAMKDGEPTGFEVLQQAWSLVRDKPAFKHYIEQAALKYSGSAG
jgi:hypothetical protein